MDLCDVKGGLRREGSRTPPLCMAGTSKKLDSTPTWEQLRLTPESKTWHIPEDLFAHNNSLSYC